MAARKESCWGKHLGTPLDSSHSNFESSLNHEAPLATSMAALTHDLALPKSPIMSSNQ
jgi:hypothetical protein